MALYNERKCRGWLKCMVQNQLQGDSGGVTWGWFASSQNAAAATC